MVQENIKFDTMADSLKEFAHGTSTYQIPMLIYYDYDTNNSLISLFCSRSLNISIAFKCTVKLHHEVMKFEFRKLQIYK